MYKMEYNPVLSAWRKGDLVRMPDGDTDRGKQISYLKLIEKAYLVETGSGRKNEPCE